MKKQLFSLLFITIGVIGLVFIGWGIYQTSLVPPTEEAGVASSAPTFTPTPTPSVTETLLAPTEAPKPSGRPDGLTGGVSARTYSLSADGFLDDLSSYSYQGAFVPDMRSAPFAPSQGRYYVLKAFFNAEQSGDYSFTADCSGSVQLMLGGRQLMQSSGRETATVTLYLEAGWYDIELHAYGDAYFDISARFNGENLDLSRHLYCSGNTGKPVFNNISLLVSLNDGLICDIPATKSGSTVSMLVPPGISLENAVLSFDSKGMVLADGEALVSGQTRLDISSARTVKVSCGSETKTYKLSVRQLETGLPCVAITSSKAITSKEEYVDSTIAINGGGASYGADLEQTVCRVKVRGAYSSRLEKKPYTIKFGKKTAVLDLTAEKSWILVASHLDLSQMRNYTAYEIAREFDATEFSPRMRFVDVFVNGQYRGLYLLGDKVDISSTRFTVDKNTDEPDIGVFLELEKDFRAEGVKGYDYFQTPQGWCVTFKDPDADKLTAEQRNYIRDYFIAAENAIISGVGYEDYIDVDSFIDWFLVETLFKNCDSEFTSSIYFHKDRGGKLKMGPVWDFDSGLGNHEGFPELLDTTGWQPRYGTYFEYLMQHEDFRARMSRRWWEKHSVVESYGALVDSTKELIRASYDENFKVYDILQNGIPPVPSYIADLKSIDGQAEFMKDWVTKRIAWLDNEFSKTDY